LGHQRTAAALLTLLLQPREHLVEGVCELRDLGRPLERKTLAGLEQIDLAHQTLEPVERRQRRPYEQRVR
jgi:hypothetical protein